MSDQAVRDSYDEWAAEKIEQDAPSMADYGDDGYMFFEDDDESPVQEADYREVLHPRDRLGRWQEIVGDFHRFNKADVVAGRVPGVKHDDTMSRGIAAHMRDREHITVGPGGYLANEKLDTLLMTHEVGHRVGQEIMAVNNRKHGHSIPPELQKYRREGESYTRGAGYMPKFENPIGLSERPEEILADAYMELLHQGLPEPEPTEGQATKDRRALLELVARTARTMGLPDRRIYRFRMEGSERFQEADYREVLHPRDREGKWIKKPIGATRMMREDSVLKAARGIANALSKFYGGEGKIEVSHEADFLAATGSVAKYRHPDTHDLLPGIVIGRSVMDRTRDPDYGVAEMRIVAHEAAHSLAGEPHGPLPGFSQTVEEGSAEILSLWWWHHEGQPFDERDAVRVNGEWTQSDESLINSVVYRDDVQEIMRRAASKVGWDRQSIVDEVLRVMQGNHYRRLEFRDSTDPHFPPPEGTHGDPVSLVRWLLGGNK